mgnify:CR=1 FL=1
MDDGTYVRRRRWSEGEKKQPLRAATEKGRFLWPSPADGVVAITSAQIRHLKEPSFYNR